jgi:hypothetical protein
MGQDTATLLERIAELEAENARLKDDVTRLNDKFCVILKVLGDDVKVYTQGEPIGKVKAAQICRSIASVASIRAGGQGPKAFKEQWGHVNSMLRTEVGLGQGAPWSSLPESMYQKTCEVIVSLEQDARNIMVVPSRPDEVGQLSLLG